MATGELEKRVLIAKNASDLAFRIGQAVELRLMRLAIRHTAAKNSDLVRPEDVEAVLKELDLAETCLAAGVTPNG
jgi:hypothetical protein